MKMKLLIDNSLCLSFLIHYIPPRRNLWRAWCAPAVAGLPSVICCSRACAARCGCGCRASRGPSVPSHAARGRCTDGPGRRCRTPPTLPCRPAAAGENRPFRCRECRPTPVIIASDTLIPSRIEWFDHRYGLHRMYVLHLKIIEIKIYKSLSSNTIFFTIFSSNKKSKELLLKL